MNREQLADKLSDIAPLEAVTDRNTKGCKGCTRHTNKLHVYDWLHDFPEFQQATKMVEVQFKNTRKGYYINSNNLELQLGDLVAVESLPGHDIGTVTLTGKLVELQMKKNNFREDNNGGLRRIYRLARPADLEKYEQAKAQEQSTMIRSRQIAEELGLQMKIGSSERVDEIYRRGEAGLRFAHEPQPPRALPNRPGLTYFRVNRDGSQDEWQNVQRTLSTAIRLNEHRVVGDIQGKQVLTVRVGGGQTATLQFTLYVVPQGK